MPFGPLTARLNKVNKAVIGAGFSSLTGILVGEIGFSSDRGEAQMAAVFYESDDSTTIIGGR